VSFLFFIASKRDISTPAFSSRLPSGLCVWLSMTCVECAGVPNILKALILSSSRLFIVQLSQPCVIALHANVFSRRTFVDILTPRLFQMLFKAVRAPRPLAILFLMSSTHSVSSVMTAPRYVKVLTCSSLTPFLHHFHGCKAPLARASHVKWRYTNYQVPGGYSVQHDHP